MKRPTNAPRKSRRKSARTPNLCPKCRATLKDYDLPEGLYEVCAGATCDYRRRKGPPRTGAST